MRASSSSFTYKTIHIFCVLLFMTFAWACGERKSPRYQAYCSESLACDEDFIISALVDGCEREWSRWESEANQAGCGIEFEYYFDCIEAQFTCENPTQTCFSQEQDYQRCLAGTL